MNAVWQQVKADLTSRPLMSALVLVTIVSAATLLTLALATLLNLSAPYDRSFSELNAAHLWLYFDRDRIRSQDIERLEALPGVAASTGLQYSIRSRVRIRETRVWVSLRALPPQMPAVNRLWIQSGRYFVAQPMEILASKDLNDLYELAVGDPVRVPRSDGKDIELPVVGLAFNPMWDTYRNSQPPFLYVSEPTLRELFPDDATWDWSLGLRLADPESVNDVLAQAEQVVRPDAIASHTDWRDVRRSAVFGAQINFVFLGSFSFFAILATVLVIASSLHTIVLSQFRRIGILKALGFSQAHIRLVYLGQYLFLSMLGSILGLGLGLVLAPLPLRSVAASLNTGFQPPVSAPLLGLVLSIIPGVVMAATFGAASMGAKANIVRAIAIGAEAPRGRAAWGVRWVDRLGLPMTVLLGLNDLFAKPFRSFLTGLNLTLGVIGIVFGLTLNQTLKAYSADHTLLGIAYDAVVTRAETSNRQTQRLLRRAPGVEAYYAEYLAEVKTPAAQAFQVRAIDGDLEAFPLRLSEGRLFQPDTDEAIAGQGLLDWLGLAVGDAVTVIPEDSRGRSITWRIVGRYPEPANAGQMLMVSLSSLARVVKPAEPGAYYLHLSPRADTAALKHYLEPRPDSDLNLKLVGQAIPGVVVYLQLAIFTLAGILIGIALINVFNTSLLAMQEKVRLIGVLKTVGMTPRQVVAMVSASAGFLGLLAACVGVPAGLLLTRALLAAVSSQYGFGEVEVTVNVYLSLLIIPATVGVGVAGSLIPGRRAARLSIVRVLRSE